VRRPERESDASSSPGGAIGESGFREALRAAERWRALADSAEPGMAIVSGGEQSLGAVIEANAALARMVDIAAEQLVALPVTSLISAEDAERVRGALRSVSTGGGVSTIEAAVLPRSGEPRPVTLTITSTLYGDHPGEELVLRLHDRTNESELVAELGRTVDRLERSNEELAGLARITVHDLAAPLRALSGLVDLLPEADLSPGTKRTLDAIRSAIDRMQAMVAGVTSYAEARSDEPKRALVELNALVERVRQTLGSEITKCAAKVTVDELPSVLADEYQLERVFLNLITNALKYAGERRPEIHVYANRAPRAWRISVADDGMGVQEADRDRIFDLFARGEVGSGSGIGLATCRRIVELHGGRVWVEPNEPTGSIFSFTLPDEPSVAGG
jgi:two-component system, chemotaxis family, sensor kinase Cph1